MTTTDFGLSMAVIDTDQALNGDWRAHLGAVDVVRVQDPPADRWKQLAAAGFFLKPQVVTWRAATTSDEEFLSRLSRKDRQNIRTARRSAEATGLSLKICPVDSGLLDRFLPLYEAQIAAMRHGRTVATEHRDQILADAENYFAVCLWDGDRLIAACLSVQSADRNEVRARFSAVTPSESQTGLARMLYLEVVSVARERGFSWVSLGSDPNLYGHMAKPGLFGFKNRLGFTAMPSHVIDPGSGSDQADRVIGFHSITDPSFLLAYATHTSGRPERGTKLQLELFSSQAHVDPRPFNADYLHQLRVHEVVEQAPPDSASHSVTPDAHPAR